MEPIKQPTEEATYSKGERTGDGSDTRDLYSSPSEKTHFKTELAIAAPLTYWTPTDTDIRVDLGPFYQSLLEKEAEKSTVLRHVESAIDHINTSINLVDDVIDKDSAFSLLGNDLEALWKLRESFNAESRAVLVLLNVAFKNYKYEDYSESQLSAIGKVLEILRKVNLSGTDKINCRKILVENKIDILSPLRETGEFEIIVRKK